jgi:hypothetical protein
LSNMACEACMKIPPVVSDYTGTGSNEKLGDLDGESATAPLLLPSKCWVGYCRRDIYCIFGHRHDACCIRYNKATYSLEVSHSFDYPLGGLFIPSPPYSPCVWWQCISRALARLWASSMCPTSSA